MLDEYVYDTYCERPKLGDLQDGRTHIIQGCRGSGKSTLLRWITRPPKVDEIEKGGRPLTVGTYVPLGQRWVAGFQRRGWISDGRRDVLFAFALNLLVADRFVAAVSRFCEYVGTVYGLNGVELEARAAAILGSQFFCDINGGGYFGVRDLRGRLSKAQQQIHDACLRGAFGDDVQAPEGVLLSGFFDPIAAAVALIQSELDQSLGRSLPVIWVFGLDELDNLSVRQQLHVNTAVRNVSFPLVFKLACLPHGHKTLETQAENNPLVPGEDFEYVALYLDPKSESTARFCLDVYGKRVRAHPGAEIHQKPDAWLGGSSLRERAAEFLETDSNAHAFFARLQPSDMQVLLPFEEKKTDSDSARQYVPSVAMRLLRTGSRGAAEPAVYGGWNDLVAASDGIPRRFLRLMDRVFVAAETDRFVDMRVQSTVIREAAEGAFNRLSSLPRCGKSVVRFVEFIGDMLERRLHRADGVVRDSCSVSFDLSKYEGEELLVLQTSIAYGVLCPWEFDERDGFPQAYHQYWLSFGLAPKFWLALRKGEAVPLAYQLPLGLGGSGE
ncbi:MAG: hypothetical protein AAF799_16920 [Myxococcota bacterium]